MSTEIYLMGFVVFFIVAILFAIGRWPEFFKSDKGDPPIFPMA